MKFNIPCLKKIITIVLCTSIVILTLSCSYQPIFAPDDINSAVTINETRRVIEIYPASETASTTGLIFYPGGLVDNHVYNILLSNFVATSNVTTVVIKMPANLAVFDINAGISIIADYPQINEWIIAGHSLGGSMAASTVKKNPTVYKSLIFMDSYPADGDSLKDWSGVVLSLYSSVEKIEDPEQMQKTLSLIPIATWLKPEERVYPTKITNYSVIHQIDGGSHSFFGTYGPQDGDYPPTISRDVFHSEVIDYMVEFFTKNDWR